MKSFRRRKNVDVAGTENWRRQLFRHGAPGEHDFSFSEGRYYFTPYCERLRCKPRKVCSPICWPLAVDTFWRPRPHSSAYLYFASTPSDKHIPYSRVSKKGLKGFACGRWSQSKVGGWFCFHCAIGTPTRCIGLCSGSFTDSLFPLYTRPLSVAIVVVFNLRSFLSWKVGKAP